MTAAYQRRHLPTNQRTIAPKSSLRGSAVNPSLAFPNSHYRHQHQLPRAEVQGAYVSNEVADGRLPETLDEP